MKKQPGRAQCAFAINGFAIWPGSCKLLRAMPRKSGGWPVAGIAANFLGSLLEISNKMLLFLHSVLIKIKAK
ncbi:hypothetical protein [Collimonas pratensis]|uniref:hypothetical protein n=1 Tax=Collimonas pratensis TaxID=279113 RepID=UPI0012E77EE5|nr:hypothetical protein [Collimonas pratensis]